MFGFGLEEALSPDDDVASNEDAWLHSIQHDG